MSLLRCPNCGADLRLYARRDESGNLVCTNCGYVISEADFDVGPEWRSFTEEDRIRRSRVGAPLTETVHDKGLTTYIYARGRAAADPRQRKLAILQARLRTHGHRKLISLLQEVNRASTRLHLPARVHETMAKLVKKIYDIGLIKKNNVNEYLAAAAIIASRIEGHPISARDVAEALNVNIQAVWRAYNNIVRKLRVTAATPPRPSMYVSKIASRLGLSGEVESLALRFTALLERTRLSQGKPPEPLAAAAVYLASTLLDKKRNQLEVARAVGTSDATIRNRYRDIVDNFYIEVRL